MADIRIGRYPDSAGSNWAVVGQNEQLASATIGHKSEVVTLTKVGAWMGKYSGSPIVRLVLFWDHVDGRPGGVAGYTNEITLAANYTGTGGGARVIGDLTSPVVVPANHKMWVGIACRNGEAALSMVAAADITEQFEGFYRKGISGNTPDDGIGSDVSNQGQLLIFADGQTGTSSGGGSGGSLPYAPQLLSTGTLPEGDLTPTLSFRHLDPDNDNSSSANVEVRQQGKTETVWNHTWSVIVANGGTINANFAGDPGMSYGVWHEWRARTRDSAGNWGPFSNWSAIVVQQANVAPNAPVVTSPVGNIPGGSLRPLLSMRHTDPDGNNATQAHMQVRQKSTQAGYLNVTWNTSVASGSNVSRTYDGSGLSYYTDYEFRGRTFDGKAWSQYSAWTTFTLYHDNKPPNPPQPVAPLPSNMRKPADVTAFNWIFTDPDASLPGMSRWERSSDIRVIIRNKATGKDVWNSGWVAAAAKYNGETITLAYTGPALQYLVDYEVIYNHRDRVGAANATLMNMRFEPGGSVEEPTTPKGRVTNLTSPGQIVAKYSDSNGTAANAVQVRAVNANGAQVAISDVLPTSVNSGNRFATPWSALKTPSGGAYAVPSGARVGVEARARHSVTGAWSAWSPTSWMDGNAAPSVPRPYAPENASAFATKPTLVTLVSDADQSPTALTVKYELATDPDFTNIVATTFGTMTAGTPSVGYQGRFELNLSGVNLVLNTTYYWRAYSFDGYLYSGITVSEASATRSTPRSFTYANVPAVTITSPATIATMHPTITWDTPAAQTAYRVTLTNGDGFTVYDSGEVTSTDKYHRIDNDGWIDGEVWNNGEQFAATVYVYANLWGASAPLQVTLSYTYPDTPSSVVVAPITPEGHVGTTVIRVGHDRTIYNDADFAGYTYYRSELSGPGGTVIDGTRTLLLINTNAGEPWLEDWTVESGKTYLYEVGQLTYVGVDEIESLTMAGEATASWYGTVLHLPYQPNLYNIHLRFGPPNGHYTHRRRTRQAQNLIEGVAMRKRVAAMGRRRDYDFDPVEFSLIRDPQTGISAHDLRERLDELMDAAAGVDSPDGRAHIVCWREGRGGKHSVAYGVFTAESDIEFTSEWRNAYTAVLGLHDVAFVLGEEVP